MSLHYHPFYDGNLGEGKLHHSLLLGLIYTLHCGNTFKLAESQYEHFVAMQSINIGPYLIFDLA